MLDPIDAISSVPYPGEDPRPYLLDLHVLMSDRLPEAWFDQCMESIFHAEGRAGYRTEILLENEVIGDEWAARKGVIQEGSAKYVGYVDMDDWLSQDALAILEAPMLAGAESIITAGVGFDIGKNNARTILSNGLRVFRRDMLDRVDWTNAAGRCCVAHALMDLRTEETTWVKEQGLYRRIGYDSLGAQYRRQVEKQNALG